MSGTGTGTDASADVAGGATFDDAHRRFQVAPMMEWTDRHYRVLARGLSRHALLWSEMVVCDAVLHGDLERLLGRAPEDAPCVLQLGGSDPQKMARAAAIGAAFGYGEINVNVGCPSDRVQAGRFGACLMAEPGLVGETVARMRDAVQVPVTVKCRLGIDRDEGYEPLRDFVGAVAAHGCTRFVVHARKAWLDGLSPAENRTVPPLRYDHVYRLKREMPGLHVTINGGIDDLDAVREHLGHVDGVMLGRTAYQRPAFLAGVDAAVFPDLPGGRAPAADIDALAEIARGYALHMRARHAEGARIASMARHLVALFQEVPGARLWRRRLSEGARHASDPVALVEHALGAVQGAYVCEGGDAGAGPVPGPAGGSRMPASAVARGAPAA